LRPFTYYTCDSRAPHSFPTRRSSDLDVRRSVATAVVTLGIAKQGCNSVASVLRTCPAWCLTWGRGRLSSEMAQMRDLKAVSADLDRKSTRLNSSHVAISYAVFCLKKK